MNILIIGIGSIGRRHLKNCLVLGYDNIDLVSQSGNIPDEFSFLKRYASVKDATNSNSYDFAILCTPTAYHICDLIYLLEKKIPNIYVEKPISHTLSHINKAIFLSQQFNSRVVVGYDLHFESGLQKVKEILDSNLIGKVVSINSKVGQYLPDWRPFQDYRKGMSASIKDGGGVMLDLVHEFDYLYWLLGEVKYIAALYDHSGTLEIETEDVAEVLLQFNNGVLGTIHLDYLQQKLVRDCLITGSNGSILWDLTTSSVKWINNNKEEFEFSYSGFARNDRFLLILDAFLKPNMPDKRLTTLEDGIESLKMVLAAKKSSETKTFISLDQVKE